MSNRIPTCRRKFSYSGILCLLLSLFIGAAWADAKTDGERGIAAYKQGRLIEAMQLLRRSAEQNYAPAQNMLAYILDQSEQDDEAFQWYQKAARQGDAAAQFGLGSMYAKGEGVARNPEQAGRWIQRSAEQHYLLAMRAYAFALENGELGFDRDPAAALKWFRKSAEAGDSVAIRRLAQAYRYGQLGLAIDTARAAELEATLNTRETDKK